MKKNNLSKKGNELLKIYSEFVKSGYKTVDNKKVTSTYNDFELVAYKDILKENFKRYKIKSILDYGSGGSDWNRKNFDESTNQSAMEYFNLENVKKYEPARFLDERSKNDCVICFDVLEHIFLGDLKKVLIDIFKCSTKLVILQIACYNAKALLPNGENAHITIRHPQWWKGYVDSISSDFPDISILLMCSESYRKTKVFSNWNAKMWHEDKNYKIDY